MQAHRTCQLGQMKGRLARRPVSARVQQRVLERRNGWGFCALCSLLLSPSFQQAMVESMVDSNGLIPMVESLREAACAHLE